MSRRKLWIIIVLVFILGGLTGILGTGLYVKKKITTFSQAGPPEIIILERMTEELDLNPSQQKKVAQIIENARNGCRSIRTKFIPEFERMLGDNIDRIKKELTDVQKAKLDNIYESFKYRRSQRFLHRRLFHKNAVQELFDELNRHLNLTPDQRPVVFDLIERDIIEKRKIVSHRGKGRGTQRHHLRQMIEQHQQSIDKKLNTILTPEQMDKYREFEHQQDDMMRCAFPGRKHRHEPH